MSTEFIGWDNLRDGMHLAMKYAEYFFNIANKFHNDNKFQLAIPYAILAFEESSKAEHLDKNLIQGIGISYDEWKEIRKHEYKLTDAEKRTKEKLENYTEQSVQIQGEIIKSLGLNAITDRKIAIEIKNKQIEVYSRFSTIKERCFYSNWNDRKKKWESFDDIPNQDQRLLSLYILHLTEQKYLLSKFTVEIRDNPFRKITNEEVFSVKKTQDYFNARTMHHQNLKTVSEMKEWEKKTDNLAKELEAGLVIFNKYFSN